MDLNLQMEDFKLWTVLKCGLVKYGFVKDRLLKGGLIKNGFVKRRFVEPFYKWHGLVRKKTSKRQTKQKQCCLF